MCHYCGGELGRSEDDRAENRNPVKSEGEHFSESCRFCREMQESQLLRQKGMNRAVTPSITPTSSFSSSERSSSSDFSVDGIPYDRGNEEECSSRSSQEDMDSTENQQRELKVKGLESRTHSSNTLTEISDRSIHGDVMRDVPLSQADSQESKENNVQNMVRSSDQELEHDNNQLDAHIWVPPEAEISEDESEGDVTDIDDDDDECCDGTKWSKSSFHGDSKDKNSKSLNLKEEKRRAVQEDINRKFRVFVNQLLKSLDVSSSTEFGENWIDIVTGLSWEAASLLKAVIDGKPVDPNAYIKVKCLATGSPSDSQVFRGLVFKKHAAHKHMPTKYERPRILLVQGVLGQSTSGLSSFKSMVQDKDYVKPVVDMIEGCHPNVILVEKSVSRDVQESILGKGITLVFDMKLHRLQRIARCTGSPIVSFDTLSSQKLKHCDSLRIEKIVEEHNVTGEGGKKPSKTLMFLEGCPTRLGCTILLKGSHSDELKRVKEVVQCAVALAYHLTLETSFLVDQQTMLSTVPPAGVTDAASEKFSITETDKLSGSGIDDSTAESGSTEIDIPIVNGFHEQSSYANGNTNGHKAETLESNGDSVFSYEPYNPAVFVGFSSLSASIKKAFEERVPSRSLSRYFGLVENPEVVPASRDVGISDNFDFEAIKDTAEDTAAKDAKEQHLLVDSGVPVDAKTDGRNGEQTKMDTEMTALDSQSILVLVSRRNALKGIICDQNHFSHIMFYKNFDVPLGKFLRDMFNQGSQCNTCDELPEAHVYYYAHHSKQLTIQIKRLPRERSLPGEVKGQLWMWSRCCKCKTKDGIPNSTKRVLISTAARSLSFGKFLELSFSEQSLLSRTSSCGHSFERDFLHFFGLGSMVAMFRYSPVTTYKVSLPPQKLEFGNSVKTGWLEKEFQNVFTKGISLFEEVASSLKQLRSHLASSSPNNQSLSDVEEMLKEERSQFEENIKNSFDKVKSSGDVSHKLLGVNRMRWELLLQASVWDRRLHSMALPNWMLSTIAESERTEQELKAKMDDSVGIETNAKASATNGGFERNEPEGKEIPIYGASVQDEDQTEVSNVLDDDKMQTLGVSGLNTYHDSNANTAVIGRLENNEEADRTIPIARESLDGRAAVSNGSHISGRQRMNEWFWLPFEELRSRGIKDLEEVYLLKPETINSSAREVLQTMNQIISEESSRLHIALDDDYYSIVSDYEDELSSLIACALALLVKSPSSGDSSDEENKLPLTRSKHGSLEGFLDKDSVNYQHAIPREDSRFMSFDGLTRLEPLAPPRKGLRRKVSFGSIKSLEKCKYSVVCLYSNEFRELRELCCPSEMDYIASLCRCKPWDAKGGKSKAVFAKTLDDRFIIKEIKRTEYESFVKFADNYFKYMKDSYQSGNQTCLAKVLGIYQVTIRQPKNGKESRHDLMVMENLNFGRKTTRQYDLKGALHARLTTTAEDVLLDQNFVNDMNNSPLYISNMSKRILQRAVWNDTSFLNSINVMDYSLLVGVDMEKRELVCGIIDYLRQYTWDKQLETWVKSSLVVPKNVLPTVISPKEYKKRFRKFMSTHFMCVPDHWCTQQQDPPCRLCDTS